MPRAVIEHTLKINVNPRHKDAKKTVRSLVIGHLQKNKVSLILSLSLSCSLALSQQAKISRNSHCAIPVADVYSSKRLFLYYLSIYALCIMLWRESESQESRVRSELQITKRAES